MITGDVKPSSVLSQQLEPTTILESHHSSCEQEFVIIGKESCSSRVVLGRPNEKSQYWIALPELLGSFSNTLLPGRPLA